MTVKSAMNNCSPQTHGALWSPCCGVRNSAASSYDDDSDRPHLSDRHSGTAADVTSLQRLRPQFSPSAGRRQPANDCRRHPAGVDLFAAEEVLRLRRLRVSSPSEVVAARRSLPRPAEACTTRQPAVVSHTVHSREIDKPLPQLAVAPTPALSVARSTPLRRRHMPEILSNDSSSKTTQTTAAASRYWQRQPTFHELLVSRGMVNNDEVAFLPRLSRPCSAPRMSGSVAFDRTSQPSTSSSTSSEAALVNELAERGRHASVERSADTRDAASVFELLSRFQSTTFPGFSHVDVEVSDDEVNRRQPHLLYSSDAPDTNNYRSTDDGDVDDVYDVLATSAEYTSLPSDAIVRWTVAENSVPDQVCQNPGGGVDDILSNESPNSDDDGASVSSMSSAIEYPPSNDVETRVGDLLTCSSGRRLTSTPMTAAIPAYLRDGDFRQSREMPIQMSSSSPCDDDDDEDFGTKQVLECNTETVASALSNGNEAVTHVDASEGCAQDQQERRRVVMYYPPQAFKFYIEQHMENVMKAYEERRRHRAQLEEEMEQLALPDDARTQMRRMLFQKESYHNRLRRTRMDRSAFRPISVLGRGAFADVTLVRKRDSRCGGLYAMKRLRKSDVLRNRQAAHVKAERDILAEADNEWIVRLFYSFQVRRVLYLLLDRLYLYRVNFVQLLVSDMPEFKTNQTTAWIVQFRTVFSF